MTYFETGKRG